MKGRLDLRESHNVVSIDPPGCVDIDDACSLRELSDCYEVGIHIADVSYYIPFNSPLDRFARDRSTSVYGSIASSSPQLSRGPSHRHDSACSLHQHMLAPLWVRSARLFRVHLLRQEFSFFFPLSSRDLRCGETAVVCAYSDSFEAFSCLPAGTGSCRKQAGSGHRESVQEPELAVRVHGQRCV